MQGKEKATMGNDVKQVRTALARAVASRQVPDHVIDTAARQLAGLPEQIRGIDVCTVGICLDFVLDGDDWARRLPDLVRVEGGQIRGIEVFPWGIINPDIVHVRVTQKLEALAEMGV
jgi:hypothetical protein